MIPRLTDHALLQKTQFLLVLTQSGQQTLIQTREMLLDLHRHRTRITETETGEEKSDNRDTRNAGKKQASQLRAMPLIGIHLLLNYPRASRTTEGDHC